MALIKNNEELDSTILICVACLGWILQGAAVVFVESYASSPMAQQMSRFIDGIVLMVFTFKFTKSSPSTANGGNPTQPTEQGNANETQTLTSKRKGTPNDAT